jgi:hypothetical protein
MGAPVNNTFWKQRSKHGRDLIFSNPTILLEAAEEYFEWADANPWHKNEAIKGGDMAGKIVQVPTQRPYTLKALCHFLDIDFNTWLLYKRDQNLKKLLEGLMILYITKNLKVPQ